MDIYTEMYRKRPKSTYLYVHQKIVKICDLFQVIKVFFTIRMYCIVNQKSNKYILLQFFFLNHWNRGHFLPIKNQVPAWGSDVSMWVQVRVLAPLLVKGAALFHGWLNFLICLEWFYFMTLVLGKLLVPSFILKVAQLWIVWDNQFMFFSAFFTCEI